MSAILAIKAAFVALALAWLAPQGDFASPSQLTQAAVELRKYLNTMPEPHQTDWKRYLEWETWGPQLAKGQVPDVELQEIHSRFYGVYEGLDHPLFLRMRNELRDSLPTANSRELKDAYPALVIRFQQKLITDQLDKLTRSRVDQRETGNWIAGAWVTGRAISQANVSARLAPLNNSASIEVRVEGTVDSPHSVAHNGSFQVHTTARSYFSGVTNIYLDKHALRITEPKFEVQTSSQISHVDGPRLLSGIALRQAQKRKGQGEWEGEAIIASRASEELKNDLAAEIRGVNEQISEQGIYHVLLKRADLAPSGISTGLTANSIHVGMVLPEGASALPPPERDLAKEHDFEVAMHESLANAVTSNYLRGSWWSDQAFARVQKDLTGGNTNEMLIGATPGRWSARWNWSKPLSARITPENLEYQLCFSKARIDDKAIEEGLVVRAKYRPTVTRWGLEFQRIGAVEASAQDAARPLAPEVAEFFIRKFSALFDERVFLDGLSPPAGGGWDALAAYNIAGVTLENGWFSLQCRKNTSPDAATPVAGSNSR